MKLTDLTLDQQETRPFYFIFAIAFLIAENLLIPPTSAIAPHLIIFSLLALELARIVFDFSFRWRRGHQFHLGSQLNNNTLIAKIWQAVFIVSVILIIWHWHLDLATLYITLLTFYLIKNQGFDRRRYGVIFVLASIFIGIFSGYNTIIEWLILTTWVVLTYSLVYIWLKLKPN